jgi:hypothetical protein
VRASQPGQSALLLLDTVDVLIREEIDYAVVGAMAASLHGIVRASSDADAVLSLVANEANKLQRIFQEAGFSVELHTGDLEDPIPALFQITGFAGGPQDLADATNAVAVAESIDVGLVRRLAKRYGREAVNNLEKILRENE